MYIKLNTLMFFTKIIYNYVYIISLILFFSWLFLSLFIIPTDYIQDDFFRILYIHAPSASLSLLFYLILTIFSIFYIIYNNIIYLYMSYSLAKITLILNIITLITGSIWGGSTWGTFWVWDIRLTSVLLLTLVLAIYIILYIYNINKYQTLYKSISIFIIFGFILIPIIKYSVDFWKTLHQVESFNIIKTNIDPIYVIPLIISFFSIVFFSILLFIIEIRQLLLTIK